MRKIDRRISDGLTMEYSTAGEGIPILVMHGGHSNCSEEFGYDELIQHGYSVITPSRAGYGNTSPAIGESLASACKAYADLLDELKLERVHVIAISAGGPSGIYFASHYPGRVRSLTLQSAVVKEWLTADDKEYWIARILFRPPLEKYLWKSIGLMSDLFPKFTYNRMAPAFSSLPPAEVLRLTREEDVMMFRKMIRRQRSGHGFMIDLAQTREVSSSHLQAVRCPAIIMHSRNDRFVPVGHAHHAHEHIPDSKLCLLDSWGHLIWLGAEARQLKQELMTFLADND